MFQVVGDLDSAVIHFTPLDVSPLRDEFLALSSVEGFENTVKSLKKMIDILEQLLEKAEIDALSSGVAEVKI